MEVGGRVCWEAFEQRVLSNYLVLVYRKRGHLCGKGCSGEGMIEKGVIVEEDL